jgi:hypothetical protein
MISHNSIRSACSWATLEKIPVIPNSFESVAYLGHQGTVFESQERPRESKASPIQGKMLPDVVRASFSRDRLFSHQTYGRQNPRRFFVSLKTEVASCRLGLLIDYNDPSVNPTRSWATSPHASSSATAGLTKKVHRGTSSNGSAYSSAK